jgi:hypothetical protein
VRSDSGRLYEGQLETVTSKRSPTEKERSTMKLKTNLKAGIKTCVKYCDLPDPNHNQTARPATSGLKLKTSLKAGLKTCTKYCDVPDPNHNQTARPGVSGLKLKTSLKAGLK